jgi:hypothetical protein
VRIPLACTLDEGDALAQRREWRELLVRVVVRFERVAADTLRLELTQDRAELPAIVALAQREKTCCAFFRFSVEVEVEALSLVMGVPEDAVALLDDIEGLLGGAGELNGS